MTSAPAAKVEQTNERIPQARLHGEAGQG
jgi:hypothetical protein